VEEAGREEAERSAEIMDYKEFLEQAKDSILEYLPDRFADGDVQIIQVQKNNDLVLDGLIIKTEDSNISPTVYLNPYFEDIRDGAPIGEVMESIAAVYRDHAISHNVDMDAMLNYEEVKDKIDCRLVNGENNGKFLSGRPFMEMEDLAVVYQIRLADLKNGQMSIPVTDLMLERYGISLEQLHEQAMRNMDVLQPHELLTLKETVLEMTAHKISGELGLTMEEAKVVAAEVIPDAPDDVLVLTNDRKLFGASAILKDEVKQEIADRLGDFYVIPSSVNELMIMKKEPGMDYRQLEDMVRNVNRKELLPNEVLSDHVYEVDAKTREFVRSDRAEERAQQREEKGKSERPSLKQRLAEKQGAVRSAAVEKNAPEKMKHKEAAR
jgi:hypothetical protein